MHIADQFLLDFSAKAAASEQTLDARLDDLVRALRGAGWQTAKQLRELGFSDRELRDLVEHDERGQILSFPGSPGYKLFDEATLEEIERSQALKSQARGMLRRFIRYQRRRHDYRSEGADVGS